MIAAVSTMFFGSLWIAFFVSNEVAPPEPEIARLGRHACLALFFLSAIWGTGLYVAFRKEDRVLHRKDAAGPRKDG
jgi:hypothetical protein